MKRIFLTWLLIAACILGYSQIKYLEIPKNDTLQRVNYEYFELGYSENHEQPGWVAYTLSQKDTVINYDKRKSFKEDKNITTRTANNSDYKSTGYDRGHLVPAADMRYAFGAYTSTFLYSNCSPQVPAFNRGQWRVLELWTRNLLKTYKNIYIVTGPILTDDMPFLGINKVSIPDFFYKVIVMFDGEKYSSIAFFMPNRKNESEAKFFIVSVDFVEAVTGMDFFSKLPDKIENEIESKLNPNEFKR